MRRPFSGYCCSNRHSRCSTALPSLHHLHSHIHTVMLYTRRHCTRSTLVACLLVTAVTALPTTPSFLGTGSKHSPLQQSLHPNIYMGTLAGVIQEVAHLFAGSASPKPPHSAFVRPPPCSLDKLWKSATLEDQTSERQQFIVAPCVSPESARAVSKLPRPGARGNDQ